METWIENLNSPNVLFAFVVLILASVIRFSIRRVKAGQNQNIKGDNNIGIAAGRDANFNTDNKPQKKNKK